VRELDSTRTGRGDDDGTGRAEASRGGVARPRSRAIRRRKRPEAPIPIARSIDRSRARSGTRRRAARRIDDCAIGMGGVGRGTLDESRLVVLRPRSAPSRRPIADGVGRASRAADAGDGRVNGRVDVPRARSRSARVRGGVGGGGVEARGADPVAARISGSATPRRDDGRRTRRATTDGCDVTIVCVCVCRR